MPFLERNGDLKCVFMTCQEIVDRVAGGILHAWGYNGTGRLGINNVVNQCVPTIVGGGSDWLVVSGTGSQAAALKTNGTQWSWGYGGLGYLGNNTAISASSPVQTISGGCNWLMVDSGTGIKQDGTLWNWGAGNQGQLGDNTAINKSSPVQTISGGNNWCFVRAGLRSRFAIKTDGTLWTWGYNYFGALGTNDRTQRSSPGQTVAGGTNWRTVCTGRYHAIATKTDGTLWVWGMQQNPDFDAIGLKPVLGVGNTVLCILSPVQTIAGGNNWKQVSAGWTLSTAVKTDGTLWVWGHGLCGGLGTNDTANRSSPVQTIAGGNNWKQVSAAGSSIAAIKTDGSLWTWGSNVTGQLGTGDTVNRSSPVQIVTGSFWKCVSMFGLNSACNSSALAIAINR